MPHLLFSRIGSFSMRSPSPGHAIRFLVLAALVSLAAIPSQGSEPTSMDQAELSEEIMSLMRQDRRAEALPLCLIYNERFSGDQIMLYNQACLENAAGQADTAAATLARAFAAGFDDFALAFADPDLAGLEDHPELAGLVQKHYEDLALTAAAKAVTLQWQEISGPIALLAPKGGAVPGDPNLFLTWTPVGLSVELQAGEPWSEVLGPERAAPWNGGPGLIITLGFPERAGAPIFQASNHFTFAFGMESDRPIGAVFLTDELRWKSLPELLPKMRVDESGNLELRTMVPWSAISPFNPLTDSVMGFNAALRVAGPQDQIQAEVMGDPAAFRPTALTRRVVPLTFVPDSVVTEILTGKVSSTISGADPIIIDMVAVSTENGPGRLTIDFLGGPGQSLLPNGQVTGSSDLAAGLNRLTRQADFSALETGSYVIKVELEFPSGKHLTWGSTILHLAPGWYEEYFARIEQLKPQEFRTAKFHLESIAAAVAAHSPRRGPGSMVTALDELGRMLDSAEKTGSILPERGTFLAVYPGSDGEDRLCHLYFPAGWRIAETRNPVLTVVGAPGMAQPLAQRIGQNYEQGGRNPILKSGEDGGFPIYCVPQSAYLGVDEAAACLTWIQETFATTTVSVAGIDGGAGVAVLLPAVDPEAVSFMIIFAGSALNPWPQADIDFVRDRLAHFPATVPVTWTDFIFETGNSGQGPLILQALIENGGNIVEVQAVRGGLNFTQAADRTVLWAEALR